MNLITRSTRYCKRSGNQFPIPSVISTVPLKRVIAFGQNSIGTIYELSDASFKLKISLEMA